MANFSFFLCVLNNFGRIVIDTFHYFKSTFINRRDEYIFKKNADFINTATKEYSSVYLIWVKTIQMPQV